jgi:hypothetical protein
MNFKVLIESLCPLRTITGLSSCSSIFILEDLAVGAVCLVESPLFPLFRAKRFESGYSVNRAIRIEHIMKLGLFGG